MMNMRCGVERTTATVIAFRRNPFINDKNTPCIDHILVFAPICSGTADTARSRRNVQRAVQQLWRVIETADFARLGLHAAFDRADGDRRFVEALSRSTPVAALSSARNTYPTFGTNATASRQHSRAH